MHLRPLARRLATSAGHHPFVVGALGTLLTFIVLAISVLTLWANRETAIEHAHDTSKNVAAVLASHISRTVESADQSLQTLIGALDKPGIRNLDPQVRHDLLFSPTASARYVTGMGVTDDKGQLVDGCCSLTRRWDFSDRDYFIVHRDHANVGLYVSGVYKARSRAGVEAIALSRRMDRRDGTFAGTALVAIDLDYFKQLLEKLDVGPRGVTAIVRTDGTLLARNPPPSAARAPDLNKSLTFPRMVNQESGFYVAPSSSDGVLRLYTFQRVPGTPFIAVVAPAMSDALAPWQRLSWIVGLSSLSVSLAFCAGVWLLAFALRGRVMAENHLRELTQTDPLTGLKNRRALDVALENEWDRLQRNDSRLSVLFIDADHFKRYNDAHGHAQGDVALQYLSQCISKHARRRGDLAARYGGEEFVVLLPDTGETGATRIAEAIRAEVEGAGAPVGDTGLAPFTVSVGCATARRASFPSLNALTKAADDALYEAKRKGRNRVDYAAVA
ncbi:MAG: GGDEF domain-containing protein [Pseudomonadota bacterium]|uniref:GGDEF domain-containing protein n=1 Tax=Ralstonia pickettii TaxID=329 RepID=UPI002714CB02|nr:GGDEF domain-containing protein [Ralstonia pickettii]MEE2979510.1 GGDEF domain-containing protein [Pseudomonadota bacterium]WKZ85884.1 GGDEF domain-containing protein [Ralstonia pickettii]